MQRIVKADALKYELDAYTHMSVNPEFRIDIYQMARVGQPARRSPGATWCQASPVESP